MVWVVCLVDGRLLAFPVIVNPDCTGGLPVA